ncbi:MAG: WYL domain-containing protein [Flavobacteriales bacterium]|jgi:predicted DNA-binding transcriptional regulator YafY|nr:WYL domain-containing protein [Flavobacteriales bacterium]
MAQNKNALIRYKTIDKCLQNRYKKWTLKDLITACSDALYEYESRDVNVSKRTIQLDIQNMRSDKLGYNAPIVVYDKKYYKYEDPNYTITDIPITENDMYILSETVEMLKQFKDFSLFSELGGIIHRLEDKIYAEQNQRGPVIHLDKNERLKGLKYLDILYQSIIKKTVLSICYQSFSARKSSLFTIHPYWLKEFNNRWFLVGSSKETLMTLALDRIISIDFLWDYFYKKTTINPDEYYKNTIGVTVMKPKQKESIFLKIDRSNAPYVLTKPFHSSQELIKTYADQSIEIKIEVHQNYELERLILGFGDSIEVLKPNGLRRRIKRKLKQALNNYHKKSSAEN